MREFSYEIVENGYFILINGQKVIHQYEPFIPDPNKTYEENAIAQIEEMKEADKREEETKTKLEELEEQVTDLQIAMTEMYESGGVVNG